MVPGFEALPAYADGGVDTHEEEEGAAEKCVNDFVVPYVCGDPVLSPSQRHEFEQRVDIREGVTRINWGRVCENIVRRVLGGCCSGASQPYACKLVLFDEVRCDRRLARADPWVC